MDKDAADSIELSELSLPRDGIREIARSWSGAGRLFTALSTTLEDPWHHSWTRRDLRRRASRVLLGMLEPELMALPKTERSWLEYLPILVQAERTVRNSPNNAVNWPSSVRYYGWPPRRYVSRAQRTIIDEIPIATLVWVLARLSDYVADVKRIDRELVERVEHQVNVLEKVITSVVSDAPDARPDRTDLLALSHSGYPWRNLSVIASLIDQAEQDSEFAFQLLEPDSDIQYRLFHLSTYGSVISALRNEGHHVAWKFPLGMSGEGPAVQTSTSSGLTWDVWFESGRSRAYYKTSQSMYPAVVSSITGVGSPLRSDVLLIDHHNRDRALILECKWSESPSYIGRDGFHQIASYALDASNGLAGEVWSFIVGPQELIPAVNVASEAWESMSLVLGSVSLQSLHIVIEAFLQKDPHYINQTVASASSC